MNTTTQPQLYQLNMLFSQRYKDIEHYTVTEVDNFNYISQDNLRK